MIAIKGHLKRGKEVIRILESLGGINNAFFKGTENVWYFIDSDGRILNDYKFVFTRNGFKTYTLEEFEKEFPFKVGDKVQYLSSIGIVVGYCYVNNKPACKLNSLEL